MKAQQQVHVGHEALVSWGSVVTRARLLYRTPSVLLLDGDPPAGTLPAPGWPVHVALPGTPTTLAGRLAEFGVHNRFLIALGSRAIRGAARAQVDLRAVARLAGGPSRQARIVDLSSSGARLRGPVLPVGIDFDLSFVPPGRSDVHTLRCVVVRAANAESTEVGVAFCGGALSFTVALT